LGTLKTLLKIKRRKMAMEKKVEESILDWIAAHFGSQEAEDPCYNIELLAEHLVETFDIRDKSLDD
jgi:hypothetical protein